MNRKSKANPSDMPEFIVTREHFNRYFEPPLPKSTFYDKVDEGMILRSPVMEGRFLLNASLKRMGFPIVQELPSEPLKRSYEDIVRLAFYLIDERLFPPPSWLFSADVVGERDLVEVQRLVFQHRNVIDQYSHPSLKLSYFQGTLDAAHLLEKALGHNAGAMRPEPALKERLAASC